MISKEKWIEIIKDFQDIKLPEMIEREVEIPIEIPLRRSISIIGPRRSGKTYEMFQLINRLMKKIKKEQILYVNFERVDLGVMDYKDLVSLLEAFYEVYPENKKEKIWIFLDEIQNVSGWEKFVRTSLDQDVKIF